MTRLEPEEARQGPKGKPVLRVLVVALILAVIAFIGMGLYGRMMPDQTLPEANVGAGVTSTNPATPATGSTSSGSVATPGQTTNPPAN